jgi:diketogulonate reductase-like aldo/keto reductase
MADTHISRSGNAPTLRSATLPAGEPIPVLGQGTWHFAENGARRDQEIAALRRGLDLGMSVIDTAEMYAGGAAEELVGEAIYDRRDEAFLVSKVLPQHASRDGVLAACEGSLRRLGTDRLDLYLLHWRGTIPLEETVSGFRALVARGLIRHWGVSNFGVADMSELRIVDEADDVATDQVLYNLTRRGIEYDLLPWCQTRGIPVMAYSPIEQGRLLRHPMLGAIAREHGATPAQIALAWVLDHEDVVAIPRASTPEHVEENRAAHDLRLTAQDIFRLDDAFPPPLGPRPLEMI